MFLSNQVSWFPLSCAVVFSREAVGCIEKSDLRSQSSQAVLVSALPSMTLSSPITALSPDSLPCEIETMILPATVFCEGQAREGMYKVLEIIRECTVMGVFKPG